MTDKKSHFGDPLPNFGHNPQSFQDLVPI